jgi:hypothetical protein
LPGHPGGKTQSRQGLPGKESLLGRVVLDDASRPFGRQKKSEIKGLFGLTGH